MNQISNKGNGASANIGEMDHTMLKMFVDWIFQELPLRYDSVEEKTKANRHLWELKVCYNHAHFLQQVVHLTSSLFC